MSHGCFGHFKTSDWKAMNLWTEVIYKFDDTYFWEFKGRPKIFMFQTCQEFVNIKSYPLMKCGKISDVLVAFPSAPGYTAKRSDGIGSWFIHYLMDALREKASSTDIMDILSTVQQRLSNHKSKRIVASSKNPPLSQVSTWMPFLFKKKFYFNRTGQNRLPILESQCCNNESIVPKDC
jgi:hypothetical protein